MAEGDVGGGRGDFWEMGKKKRTSRTNIPGCGARRGNPWGRVRWLLLGTGLQSDWKDRIMYFHTREKTKIPMTESDGEIIGRT